MTDQMTPCPCCGVAPGRLHARGCDVEDCPYCGGQLLSCCCEDSVRNGVPDDDRMLWTGQWPGTAACREFGWYARRVAGRGWLPCGPNEPGAREDLNRLHAEGAWDRENKRWVRSTADD